MTDSFVPLVPVKSKSTEPGFSALPSNGPAAKSAATVPRGPGAAPDACAKPIVTLQREGDVVTGIRIQCGCGQVVDLTCVY